MKILDFHFLRCMIMTMKYETSNPIMNSLNNGEEMRECADRETLTGTINKCFILLGLVFLGAIFSWTNTADINVALSKSSMFLIVGFVIAMITVFKKEWAGRTAPLYALCEGLAIGAISKAFEASYPGIVFQAVLLTFGTTFGMLAAYRSGMIKASEKFYAILTAATLGICVTYLVSWILGFFNIQVPMIHSSGSLGITFSAVVVVIAALSLVLDFDVIVRVSDKGYPKYMGWYAAFGLMVTLIWLYFEILRLLVKLNDRRN